MISTSQMANAVRFLSIDMVNKANSGHPGAPLGMADFITVLYKDFLHYNPKNPNWHNRDRFVLSNGHASALLYSVLHLTGQELTIDDLKKFRQLHSKTAGHPEYAEVQAIETTTGPLGQGLATAVGMAIGQKIQAERYGEELFNNKTYVTVGDGCLMEGISHEAAELASNLKLNNLIVLFDNNNICIDGKVTNVSPTNIEARFKAYGFNVLHADGHNHNSIHKALSKAQNSDAPVFISFKTHIGYGSPKIDSSASHGSPLGEEGADATREKLGWDYPPFDIPQEIYSAWQNSAVKSEEKYKNWQQAFAKLSRDEQQQLNIANTTNAVNALDELKKKASKEKLGESTRKTSGNCFDVIFPELAELISGSADLTGSNNTLASSMKPLDAKNYAGNYIHYGVREHAMGAIMNGISLYGGLIPTSGTFLVFSDYMRTSIRLSALMNKQVIYILTHDSIGLGEDGPTHQPVEHLASLRAIPNLYTFRPADQIETAECWQIALKSTTTPSAFALSRQNMPTVRKTHIKENLSAMGGYILNDMPNFEGIFIATGSEIQLAIQAQKQLKKQGVATRVVSMPCQELFNAQTEEYKQQILPNKITARIAIEAGGEMSWHKYIGLTGKFIGMNGFGASAPALDLYEYFGITAQNAVTAMLKQLEK